MTSNGPICAAVSNNFQIDILPRTIVLPQAVPEPSGSSRQGEFEIFPSFPRTRRSAALNRSGLPNRTRVRAGRNRMRSICATPSGLRGKAAACISIR